MRQSRRIDPPRFFCALGVSVPGVRGVIVTELPHVIEIRSCGSGVLIPAEIIRLTPDLARHHIDLVWWNDLKLLDGIDLEDPSQVQDKHWSWEEFVESFGSYVDVECVAVRTSDNRIQGAMILYMGADSFFEDGQKAAEIERIATRPCNRPTLVSDPEHSGVGAALFVWGLFQSYLEGWEGRLNLYALDKAVEWYQGNGMLLTGAVDPEESLPQLEMLKATSLSRLRAKGYVT
jgi:hypothetical protein